MSAHETTQAGAPAFPATGPSLVIRLEVGTTATHLAAGLRRRWGSRRMGYLTNADGSPLDTQSDEATWRHWEIDAAAVREQTDIGPILHHVLTTWLHGPNEDATATAVIRYALHELTPGPAPRCKVSIRCSPVHPEIFQQVAHALTGILRDFPQARETLVHYLLYVEEELPGWMAASHRDFCLLLAQMGSQERGYIEDHVYRYAAAVETARRAARENDDGAGANEQPAGGISDEPRARQRSRADAVQRAIEETGRLYYDQALTQEQIAERLGKSPSTIKRYLRRHRENRGHKGSSQGVQGSQKGSQKGS